MQSYAQMGRRSYLISMCVSLTSLSLDPNHVLFNKKYKSESPRRNSSQMQLSMGGGLGKSCESSEGPEGETAIGNDWELLARYRNNL